MITRIWITEYAQGTTPLRTRIAEAEVLPRLTQAQLHHIALGLEVVVITANGRTDVRSADAEERRSRFSSY